MQPEGKRRRKHVEVKTQVLMPLKSDLWWVEGFPLAAGQGALEWVALPSGRSNQIVQRAPLESIDLRAAGARAHWLVRRFPRGLRAEVGDTKLWLAGVQATLVALETARSKDFKGLLRAEPYALLGYTESTRKLAHELRAAHPQLAASVDAGAWLHAVRLDDALQGLKWIAAHARELSVITSAPASKVPEQLQGPTLVWWLFRLEEHGGPAFTDVLLGFLGDRALDLPTAVGSYVDHCFGWLNRFVKAAAKRTPLSQPLPARPVPPDAKNRDAILSVLPQLASFSRSDLRGVGRLLVISGLRERLQEWERWWAAIDRELSRFEKRLISRPPGEAGGLPRAGLHALHAKPGKIDSR